MGAPAAGSVVVVRFPFSDLSRSKLRPAVVVAEAGRRDRVLMQVTSNPYADLEAVELTNAEFATGGLQRTSFARPGKLFTAHEDLIADEVGALTPAAAGKVLEAVVDPLRRGRPER